MTACIIHFGVDLAIRVPVLKSAGVQVDTCSSIDSLIETFEREQVDAVVVPQNPELNLGSVVSITHSRPNIPVIVFPESPSQLDAKFDLVIPVLTPPRQWLADIANLIAQNETLVVESQHLREQASSESSAVKQRLFGTTRKCDRAKEALPSTR